MLDLIFGMHVALALFEQDRPLHPHQIESIRISYFSKQHYLRFVAKLGMRELPESVGMMVMPDLDKVYVSGKAASIVFDRHSGAIQKFDAKEAYVSSCVQSMRPLATSWNSWIKSQVPKIRERFSIPHSAKWKVRQTKSAPVLEFYEIESPFPQLSEANRAIVMFGKGNGIVESVSQSWGHGLGPTKPLISATRAQRIGLEHYSKTYSYRTIDKSKLPIGISKHGERFATDINQVKLALVLPTQAHQSGVPYDRKGEIRLAYVVACQHESVWVDARNGAILGGVMCR